MAAFQEAQSPQYGRHLIALTPLSAGTVVLEQQPYAAVLYDDRVSVRCDWCFQTAQPGSTLMRCTRSKFAHYCSRDHQKAAWKAYYKQECAALGACAPHVPPATVRLAARVLWRRDRCAAQIIGALPNCYLFCMTRVHMQGSQLVTPSVPLFGQTALCLHCCSA